MPKFDVIYRYTVIGVRTVEADTPEIANTQHLNTIANVVLDTHGLNSIIIKYEASCYDHDDANFETLVAQIQSRIADDIETLTFSRQKPQ